ncbi:hypothetical protein EHV15_06285 [Paenibacillus oralis]|uniref:WD40 repeat domain-containing protein n=1 Tax=Paenibacillus oralis TaxID=2490856 RepID=A0A3P3TXT2_9BACL|nr:hypothetical protein [Paenibacillus oralis]RRJ62594.1 hypothetical protein EHV15_06285 [Paenibacillus oralis]
MKRITIVLILGLVCAAIAGCGNTNTPGSASSESQTPGQTTNSAAQQPENQSANTSGNPGDQSDQTGQNSQGDLSSPSDQGGPVDLSVYYARDLAAKLSEDDSKLTWTAGGITVTAEKKKGEFGTPVIASIAVKTEGQKSYTIKFDPDPKEIRSLALSADDRYLAINLFYSNVGDKLIVVNLESGKQIDTNAEIGSMQKEYGQAVVETVHAYNWSPDGHTLALSFGDTSSAIPALYDPEENSLHKVGGDKNYITTAFALWHKDGNSVDFISEQPSDEYHLYRYDIEKNTTTDITALSTEELSAFTPFRPVLAE